MDCRFGLVKFDIWVLGELAAYKISMGRIFFWVVHLVELGWDGDFILAVLGRRFGEVRSWLQKSDIHFYLCLYNHILNICMTRQKHIILSIKETCSMYNT